MYKAIDVSEFQGDIKWNSVKNSGINAAIIRVGGRFGASGRLYEDCKATANIKNAIANGIKIGVYFFTQAINTKEAEEEAKWTINYIKPYAKHITLPVVIDTEWLSGGRHNTLSAKERKNVCKAFCEVVKKAGYIPMIYGSTSWLNNDLRMSELTDYEVWVAQYHTSCEYKGKYSIWQYTSSGRVNGISGNVDMNNVYKEYGTDGPTHVDPEPQKSNKLDVDGIFGPLSVSAAQTWTKSTYVDGVISGQVRSMQRYFPSVTAVEWGTTGSPFVSKLQQIIGANIDGFMGPNTSERLQTYLNKKGYGLTVDKIWGPKTSMAFQDFLNKELKLE